MEYVHLDRVTRWRMHWYNEIKVPLLTAAILFDNGVESLHQRTETLHKLVTQKIMPALPGESKGLTPDEEFIAISLRNKLVHARAKLIIMQMLEQISNPDKLHFSIRVKIKDMT
jgi:hypothetical protein